MTTRFWWIFLAVALGALVAAGMISRVYVGQQLPPEAERPAPTLRH
jgi:hypothetical protein